MRNDKVFPLLDAQPVSSFDGVFYVTEYVGFDFDEDGLIEAYALGTLRSSSGGTAPSTAWQIGSTWIDLILNLDSFNPPLQDMIQSDSSYKIAIKVSDWRCTFLAYDDGNIPKK